jgi:hypothetical protein
MDIRESELRTTAMYNELHQQVGKNGAVTGMTQIVEEDFDDEDLEEDEDDFFGDLGLGSHDSDKNDSEDY